MRIRRPVLGLLALASLACLLVVAAILTLVTQPFVSIVPYQSPKADPARLWDHVKYLSVDLYPRSYEQSRHIEQAADYILKGFKAAGGSVAIQDVVVDGEKYRNIIARFGPPAGDVLVIGAHYDSHGETIHDATGKRGYSLDTHTPGADDNASGVAGLLELARLLGNQAPSRPVELVAYTLEEPPHFRSEQMGSAWHVRSVLAAKRTIRLMISLEMIGYFSDEPGSQHYPLPGMSHLYSDRGNFIALVGKFSDFEMMRDIKAWMAGATDLPVYSINAPPLVQGIDFSDHLSYWNAGIPAIMVTDTAFMRNEQYHQQGDTYDKLDYRRMAKVVEAVFAAARQY